MKRHIGSAVIVALFCAFSARAWDGAGWDTRAVVTTFAGGTATDTVTFSGTAPDITSATNEGITITPAGSGDTIITVDADSDFTATGFAITNGGMVEGTGDWHTTGSLDVDGITNLGALSVSAAGAITGATGVTITGNSFTTTRTSASTAGYFASNGALVDSTHNVFAVTGTAVAHTNASNVMNGFYFAPVLSSAHSAAAPVTALFMGAVHNSGSILETSIVRADSATNLDYVVKTPYFNVTGAGNVIASPPSAQTIAAGNTIAADACGTLKQITAGGAVTTDTTNTFTAPAAGNAGCCMDVVNVGAQNITLDNNGNFFSPAGGDVVMTGNDSIRVCSNGTAWYAVTALVAN